MSTFVFALFPLKTNKLQRLSCIRTWRKAHLVSVPFPKTTTTPILTNLPRNFLSLSLYILRFCFLFLYILVNCISESPNFHSAYNYHSILFAFHINVKIPLVIHRFMVEDILILYCLYWRPSICCLADKTNGRLSIIVILYGYCVIWGEAT